MLAEKKIFESIPSELEASWVVNYLSSEKFSPSHVRVLRSKTSANDKTLSWILNIAPKTLTTYTKDVSNAKIDTKEHILMLIALLKHGTAVFGSSEDFNKWLEVPNIFLDQRRPMDFLNTINGIKMIDNRLIAMEYGDNV
ncbi:MAG: MbcA/ParS/Xre antitoxin family protein [Bacteroidota bacterium]